MAADVLIAWFTYVFGIIYLSDNVFCDVLFTARDDILILNRETFQGAVLNQSHGLVVEFYNSWCGHCIRFAPVWKDFARSVDGWKTELQVAVLDCSEQENVPTCEKYGVDSYPTIKFFRAEAGVDHVGEALAVEEETVKHLETLVIAALEAQHRPRLTARLTALRSLQTAWSLAPPRTEYVVVIFEEEGSLLGKKVILDAIGYAQVHVARIERANLRDVSDVIIPSLNLIDRDGAVRQLITGEHERSVYKQAICDLIGVILQNEGGAGDAPRDLEQPLTVHHHSGHVHMQDVEATVTYALRHEIATCKSLAGTKLTALKTFIHVLAKYFPGQVPIKQYIWSIDTWLQTQNNNMTGSEWLAAINRLETDWAWIPHNITWTGCHGSKAQYRRYPCGLWTLFHTLTVSALTTRSELGTAKEVLLGMKAYIIHFFGCSECAENFKKEIRYLDTKVNSLEDAVLYLWEVHNSVNKRLHGDLTEDPVHPKVQFPSNEICSTCHMTKYATNDTRVISNRTASWNNQEVLLFLRRIYSYENIVKDSAILKPATNKLSYQQRESDLKELSRRRKEKRLKVEEIIAQQWEPRVVNLEYVQKLKEHEVKGRTFKPERKGVYLGLNGIDISICLLFYFVCTCLLVLIYYKLYLRKRRSRSKLII